MEMVGSWVAAPPTDGGGSGSGSSSDGDRDWLCGSSVIFIHSLDIIYIY